jgi:hypothetical protein
MEEPDQSQEGGTFSPSSPQTFEPLLLLNYLQNLGAALLESSPSEIALSFASHRELHLDRIRKFANDPAQGTLVLTKSIVESGTS